LKEWQKNAIAIVITAAVAVAGIVGLFALVSHGFSGDGIEEEEKKRRREEEDPHLPAPSEEALDRMRGD
jgi:hypothetical protein